jgi:hypothetical protein
MMFRVPFYKQVGMTDCGIVALKMVFSFLGKDFQIEGIGEKTGIKLGKATSTLQLAKAAVELGFRVKLISKSVLPTQENMNSEFHKKYAEEDYIQQSTSCYNYLKTKNTEMMEKSIDINELLSYVTESSIPIVLLDWNVVSPKYNGYQGHFVPIVGYDKETIYVHNPSASDLKEYMPIKRQLFDSARKSKGTDEDILIIYKN